VMKDHELFTRISTRVTYWERDVDAAGSFVNVSVNWSGYVEMTGYERAFRAP
jgi:predicted secreted hydrolase